MADLDRNLPTEQEFFDALRAHGLSDRDLAHAAEVSVPIAHRWNEGRNAPHPLIRRAVLRFIREAPTRVKP
jgi:DNA-binding transcriptional regulator YiaG